MVDLEVIGALVGIFRVRILGKFKRRSVVQFLLNTYIQQRNIEVLCLSLENQEMNYTKKIQRRALLILGLLLLIVSSIQARSNDVFQRSYEWKFGGKKYQMTYPFAWDTYRFYQGKPRVFYNYAVYTYENPKYAILSDFAENLRCIAENQGMDSSQTLNFVIAFVQQLQYQTEVGEYPKYPIETLSEKGGDCEDTSILLAALLRELGYDAILINPPRHMAIALECKSCKGSAYQFQGKRYFYIETTASGFPIGRIPGDYTFTKDRMFGLDAAPEELWVLNTFLPKREVTEEIYIVREDAITRLGTSQEGGKILARARLQTVDIGGKISLKRSVRLLKGR